MKRSLAQILGSYGYWISPEGEKQNVAFQQHDSVALQMGHTDTEGAHLAGCVRVINPDYSPQMGCYYMNMSFVDGITQSQMITLKSIISQSFRMIKADPRASGLVIGIERNNKWSKFENINEAIAFLTSNITNIPMKDTSPAETPVPQVAAKSWRNWYKTALQLLPQMTVEDRPGMRIDDWTLRRALQEQGIDERQIEWLRLRHPNSWQKAVDAIMNNSTLLEQVAHYFASYARNVA